MNDFIDAHTHLSESLKDFPPIFRFINSVRYSQWENLALEAEQNSENMVPFFGLHPWFLEDLNLLQDSLWKTDLENLLLRFPFAGLGETGLDKITAQKNPRLSLKKQADIFIQHLLIARNYQRPVSVHLVRCPGLLTEILQDFKDLNLLIHGFSGSEEAAKKFLKDGFYLSFSPGETRRLLEFRVFLPLERIFLETDGKSEHERFFENFYHETAESFGISLFSLKERMVRNAEVFTHRKIAG